MGRQGVENVGTMLGPSGGIPVPLLLDQNAKSQQRTILGSPKHKSLLKRNIPPQ